MLDCACNAAVTCCFVPESLLCRHKAVHYDANSMRNFSQVTAAIEVVSAQLALREPAQQASL